MPSMRLTEVIQKTVYIVGTLILQHQRGRGKESLLNCTNSHNSGKKKIEVMIFNLGYFFHVTVMFEGEL